MFQYHPYSRFPFSSRGASSGVPANLVLPLTPDRTPIEASPEEEVEAAAAAAKALLSSASMTLSSLTGLWGYLRVPSA